ncbi:hypothetical protein M0R72_13745 [Candidatus Pacearchaeota archaeon]|jgi:hypothetical protein|nr:hypothetical protein [Candidatus Pacearchaeota archaeon]
MSVIGNIAVSLTASTKNFERGMKKARGVVSSFGGAAGAIVGKLGAMSAALTGIAGAAGLVMLTKNSMTQIDATAKLSDRLGIATEKLQGLRHAAELTGAGSAALENGLAKMQKTIGEASKNLGLGKRGFEALGISIDSIMGKSPDVQFSMIADKINMLATAEEKAYAATAIFGRGGQALINTLAQGSTELAAMQKDAEKLGLAFNRVDAAQVERANDALTRMHSVFVGLGNSIAIAISPYIETLANQFADAGFFGENAGAKIVGAFEKVLLVVEKIRAGVHFLALGFIQIAKYSGADIIPSWRKTLDEQADMQADLLETAWSGRNVKAFFDNVEKGAAAARDKINNRIKPVGVGIDEETGVAKAMESNVRGSFRAASVVGGGESKIDRDQLNTQKSMLNELKNMRYALESGGMAIAG